MISQEVRSFSFEIRLGFTDYCTHIRLCFFQGALAILQLSQLLYKRYTYMADTLQNGESQMTKSNMIPESYLREEKDARRLMEAPSRPQSWYSVRDSSSAAGWGLDTKLARTLRFVVISHLSHFLGCRSDGAA